MEERPIVHLISQAHIDPDWMWTWEEGAREALSTFHTAADLLEEFPEFIFNHNESLLYEWVEEYAPPLFERIKRLVAEGRWNISGGWYLQPDCNLAGGETLIRLILEGRAFFAEKFGVRPVVAYNFDTFGHPGTLPQLLKQSGFEMYIHFRPLERQLELPGVPYCWQGIDGTEVVGLRPHHFWYCTPRYGMAQEQARAGIEIARQTGRDVLVPWGTGDHGGGATRNDLLQFRQLIQEMADADVEVRHSTPEAYLKRVQAQSDDNLPVHRGEMQRTLAGCYTSVAPIKRQMREGEALLASAERWATIAWWRLRWPYPYEALREAWKRLMFNTFHDVLCGSLLEDAIPGVNDIYGYAHDVARRIIVRSQHALVPDVPPQANTIPLYVYNAHPIPLQAPVGLNFLSDYAPPRQRKTFNLYDDQGNPVTCQRSGGATILAGGTWQPFVGFAADMPPLSSRRYEIRFEPEHGVVSDTLAAREDEAGITLENRWWVMRFDRQLAAPVSLRHRESGRDLLAGPVQMRVMEDVSHAWGGEDRVIYNEPVSPLTALTPDEAGAFCGLEGREGPSLRIIASGPVSITVECLVGWQHTRAALRFTLYADLPWIDVDTRLYMQARRKMVKLTFPFDLPNPRAVCEVPYGTAERPADATEWSYSRWARLESADLAIGIANNGQNGFDLSAAGTLNLSLSRGGIHSSWEGDPGGQTLDTAQSYTFMDQEQIDTRFRLLAGRDITAALISAALELNQPLERFYAFHIPCAPQTPAGPFLTVEPPTVVLGALKKAERDEALIIRLIEMAGESVTATVRLEGGAAKAVAFTPYAIRTFKVTRDGDWQPTNLLEETL